MKILLTGAAGFIGSHLLEALVKKRFKVVAIDNFESYYPSEIKLRNLEEARKAGDFHFLKCDITDFNAIFRVAKKFRPSVIYHLAARPGVRESFKNPTLYTTINVTGTLNILEIARRLKINKMIFASSSSVYGNARTPFNEDDINLQPISLYGISKLVAERYCKVYHELFGINIIILRYFTAYGPRQRPDMGIFKFTKAILDEQPLTIYGGLNTKRDYTYISDIIEATVSAMNSNASFDIYNLGNSTPVSLKKLIALLEKITGKKAILKMYPPQKGDVKITYASISKAKKHLGYHPKVTIEEGLSKFVEWFLRYYKR